MRIAKHFARRVPPPPEEWYPAGRTGVTARHLTLAGGERTRVVESGPPDGTPVLMMHGWGASAYSFRRLIPMLAAHGLRGVAVDLRGHGLSDRPEAGVYGAAALVRHVEALLDALGVARAVLVGQSMSGGVVLDALRTVPHRLRGAVLLAPIGLVPIRRITVARLVRAERWLPERVPRVVITLLMRRVYGVRGTWGGRDVDEYWWPLRTPRSMAALMALVNEFDWVPRDPWEASAGAPPVRVLLGERDKLIACARAAARARQLPRTQVTVIPGAGHLLAEEVAEEVASAIVAVASPAPTPRAGA